MRIKTCEKLHVYMYNAARIRAVLDTLKNFFLRPGKKCRNHVLYVSLSIGRKTNKKIKYFVF